MTTIWINDLMYALPNKSENQLPTNALKLDYMKPELSHTKVQAHYKQKILSSFCQKHVFKLT